MPPIDNPLLLDIPETFAETERLIIRVPRPGDGPAQNEAVNESLEELKPWMPWAHRPVPVDASEEVCRRAAAQFAAREDMMLFIWARESGRFLGGTGLHRFDWSVPRFEIGYWMRTSETGKGYVKEAVRALTDFAFTTLQAERMEIHCDARNRPSAVIARRCGYVYEGCIRHSARDPYGDLWDRMLFSKLRSEWLAEQKHNEEV